MWRSRGLEFSFDLGCLCFLIQIATAIESYSKGKPVVEVTKVARRKCRCSHTECVCGISISVQKADCPCECAGQCY